MDTTFSQVTQFAATAVLLMVDLFLGLYVMESLRQGRNLRRLNSTVDRIPGGFARWVLLAMTGLHQLRGRFGYLPLLVVAWLLLGQGGMLLRVAALGLVIGGATIHRMTLTHRPLVQRFIEGKPVGQLEMAKTTLATTGEPPRVPELWRYQAGEKPWGVLGKWPVAVLLLVVNGLLVRLLFSVVPAILAAYRHENYH